MKNALFFYIINNSFLEDKEYNNSCQNKQKGIHFDYFRKTKEFLFSCSYSGIRISIIKFDEDGNEIRINNTIKYYISVYGLFSSSIIMLSTFSQYSIIYTGNDPNSFHYLLSKELIHSYI